MLLLFGYFTLNVMISKSDLEHKGKYLSKLDLTWGCVRAFGLLLNIMQLVCTIYKLKTAKVQTTNSGHLNLRDATLLLIFMIAMCGTGLASAIDTKVKVQGGIDMARDLLDYFLAVLYFKMITKFIASFRLQTVVDLNNNVQIVAIEPNGNEVFRFTLDDD